MGTTLTLLAGKLAVLDTGTGPNFLRNPELRPALIETVKMGPSHNIEDACGKPIMSMGTMPLIVRLEPRVLKSDFIASK